jgi:hypothetical protein
MRKNLKAGGKAPEPSTPGEWHEAVSFSYAMLVLDLAMSRGLVQGPRANKGRCLELLRRGRAKGYLPVETEATAALFGMIGNDPGLLEVVIKLLQEEDDIKY